MNRIDDRKDYRYFWEGQSQVDKYLYNPINANLLVKKREVGKKDHRRLLLTLIVVSYFYDTENQLKYNKASKTSNHPQTKNYQKEHGLALYHQRVNSTGVHLYCAIVQKEHENHNWELQ